MIFILEAKLNVLDMQALFDTQLETYSLRFK